MYATEWVGYMSGYSFGREMQTHEYTASMVEIMK